METIDVLAQNGSYEHPYFVGVRDVPGFSERDEHIVGSWIKCNTDMLMTLMDQGHKLTLPDVSQIDLSDFDYSDEDRALLASAVGDLNDIVSIEYVGDMEVQCIEVEDPGHMYLTDNFISNFNTSNIVFLKSTDDSMIDTLEKMSGKTHRAYGDSKMVTVNKARVFMRNEDTSSVTISVKEEPVIKYNDMAFISERNSIVFRAGDPPIWNRNELVLPMSWRLFLNKIEHPGRDYSLQTIPTLSSAIDFDVRKNQPDFESMVNKRLAQAVYAKDAMAAFRDVFGYSDYEVEQLDPDIYADAVVDIIAAKLNAAQGRDPDDYAEHVDVKALLGSSMPKTELNEEQKNVVENQIKETQQYAKKIYAGGNLSRDDIAQFDQAGRVLNISHALDEVVCDAFRTRPEMFERDRANFRVKGGELYSANGRTAYLVRSKLSANEASAIANGVYRRDVPVYSDDRIDTSEVAGYVVSDDFWRYLISLNSWEHLAGGVIDRAIKLAISDV